MTKEQNLIDFLEEKSFMICTKFPKGTWPFYNDKDYYKPMERATNICLNMLKELKQRRESDIIPAQKFVGLSPQQQWLHVMSETHEILDAFDEVKYPRMNTNHQKAREHLAEEIVDGQGALETFARTCGFTDDDMAKARLFVRQKNAARDYDKGDSNA